MPHQHVVLHVSPHPDDEAIAVGMTLGGLAQRGWQVVNLLLSAGRPGDEPRRLAEARDAAGRAGYHLDVVDEALRARPGVAVANAIERYQPALVISPQPHDGHPAHESVGRAVRDVLAAAADPPIWWMWGLWAELAMPTLYLPFEEPDLARAIDVLAAYAGELARNDYQRLVRGRAAANAVLGSERIFGFGTAAASEQPYAELLTEAVRRDGAWSAGERRVVDLATPLPR